MKTILTAALALAALASTVLADEKYLTDVQMDQVTAGSCGVGSQCLVGAVAHSAYGAAGGLHSNDPSFCGGDSCFLSLGFAGTTPPSGGGGGGIFVVDGTLLQRGGAGVAGGCVNAPCSDGAVLY
jgi:hypothetical protein